MTFNRIWVDSNTRPVLCCYTASFAHSTIHDVRLSSLLNPSCTRIITPLATLYLLFKIQDERGLFGFFFPFPKMSFVWRMNTKNHASGNAQILSEPWHLKHHSCSLQLNGPKRSLLTEVSKEGYTRTASREGGAGGHGGGLISLYNCLAGC